MTLNIIPIGNSDGIILPKSLMKRFSLKRYDTLEINEEALELTLHKKEKIGMEFFDKLPECPEAYGNDTEKYLEMMEEPEDE